MKFALVVSVIGCLSGCSLSVGAGASARVGSRPSDGGFECDGFESCDVIYRTAVARAQHCQTEDDCEQADADVARIYRILRAQTTRELDALRSEASEARDAARRQAGEECRQGH